MGAETEVLNAPKELCGWESAGACGISQGSQAKSWPSWQQKKRNNCRYSSPRRICGQANRYPQLGSQAQFGNQGKGFQLPIWDR